MCCNLCLSPRSILFESWFESLASNSINTADVWRRWSCISFYRKFIYTSKLIYIPPLALGRKYKCSFRQCVNCLPCQSGIQMGGLIAPDFALFILHLVVFLILRCILFLPRYIQCIYLIPPEH